MIICCDFDGTITEQGELSPLFFKLLPLVQQHNFVINTGRSSAHGLFLIKHLGVSHVIVENGSLLLFVKEEDKLSLEKKVTFIPLANNEDIIAFKRDLKKLLEIFTLEETDDHFFRKIDASYYFDSSKVSPLEIQQEIVKQNWAIAFRYSPIHCNFFPKSVNKMTGLMAYKEFLKKPKNNILYFGDSLNDQDVFLQLTYPDLTIGVSNIKKNFSLDDHWPSFCLLGKEREEIKGVLSFLKYYL